MTLPETIRANLEWTSLEGVILDGGYEIKRLLSRTPEEAVFQVRVLGGAGLELTAKFHRAGPSQSAGQLAIWELLRELPHRNVGTPVTSGRKIIDGGQTVYALLAIPDDRLSGLAGERALTEEEAREVLRNSIKALGHLHANGLAHGCLSPEQILAQGDTVQLAGECVRKLNDAPPLDIVKPRYVAPESGAFQSTAAADVWCLGATLFETLAQKPYPENAAEAKAAIAGLPLSVILRRCLAKDPEKRATLVELQAILEKGPSAALDVAEEDEQPDAVLEESPSLSVETAEPSIEETSAADSAVSQETDKAEIAAVDSDVPETTADTPIIQAPLPPKQSVLDMGNEMGDEKPPAEAAAAPAETAAAEPAEEPPPKPPAADPVPIGDRHSPIRIKRRPVEARILPLPRSADEAASTPEKFVSPPVVRERRGIRLKAGPGSWRGFVAGAAALLMVAAVVWQVIIPRLQSRQNAASGAAASAHPGGASAWLTRTLPAGEGALPDARRQASSDAGPVEESGAAASPARSWRVVLYAYEHQSDAERRVELVNHNHPGLRAHLFVAGNGGPYLVVTGDATSREHAQALRKKAVQLGVSRAHVQEFTQ